MQIYIDSADVDQIQEAISWGIVDGITTNPSLIKAAAAKHLGRGGPDALDRYIRQMLEVAGEDRPVSLEVIGPSKEEMLRQGFHLFEKYQSVAENVVIKVPVNPSVDPADGNRYAGLEVISELASDDIPVNVTLVFTPEQALLAAKAGARYVSPFAGRIDDRLRRDGGLPFGKLDYYPAQGQARPGGDAPAHDHGILSGVHLVEQIVSVLQNYDFECEVLAASIRNPRQARECALVGADIATIPFEVIRAMVDHPQTAQGMKAFLDDVVPEYRNLFPKA